MISMRFRDPQSLSSALASLGMLQPRAFGSLNHVETLGSASNYYLEYSCSKYCNLIGHSEVSISHRPTTLVLGATFREAMATEDYSMKSTEHTQDSTPQT